MADQEYREGDDANEPKKESEVPVTAFVVLLYADGRIEAGTNLENMEMIRPATMRDLRDVSAALSKDIQTTMTAQATAGLTAQSIGNSMRQAQAEQMKAQLMQNPSGLRQ